MDNVRRYCVYKHTSPSGKIYIGVTCQNPEDRWKGGFGYLNKKKNGQYTQPSMARAIIKYGWDNFDHEVLLTNLTKEDAARKEKELISRYKSDDREFGYNIEHGGNSIDKFSDETKRKISESKIGEKNGMYGKPSPKRVQVLCIETNIIYDSLKEAEGDTRTNRVGISRCCQGIQKTAGKLHWRYPTSDDLENKKGVEKYE